MSQLLVLHRFFKAAGFFPEETLPSREVCALEQSVFKDTFDATKCLNHVGAVVVKVPQLSIMLLMRPPEGILLQYLVLFEVLPDSPALIVSKS